MIFSITTTQGGMCMAPGTDVCKVPAPPAPPIPTPLPNIANCNQASSGTCSQKVTIAQKPLLTKKSEIPMSSGDEAGSAGGVVSGKIKGECTFVKFSAKVKIEGQFVIFQTCNTGQNGKNANAQGGMQMDPSQPKVKVSG